MFVAGRNQTNAPALVPSSLRRRKVIELAENRLRGNPYLVLKNVSCDYWHGALVLRGCLPSYYLKQRAQDAVTGLEGVERIVNEIEVVDHAGH